MKKEKITRATLDELEKTMPVLSENEQRNCTGGYRYYDESGMFIEKIGDENEIRIINRTNYNNIKPESGNFGIRDMEILESFSTSLSSACSLNVKEAVIRSIAMELSVNDIQFFYDSSNTAAGRFNTLTGEISINMESSVIGNNNYYDIYLTIVHEKQHKDTTIDMRTDYSELQAYLTVRNHIYFCNCSENYKSSIEKQIGILGGKLNNH
ncbi:MAG: hypothetical protein Q4F97_12495 [Bacteroidales bacterium]|nr:hypothetical protein [Bacteroidales bacterium]